MLFFNKRNMYNLYLNLIVNYGELLVEIKAADVLKMFGLYPKDVQHLLMCYKIYQQL